jgi:hypothetical protein
LFLKITTIFSEDFELQPLPYIKKISMSFDENETPEKIQEGAQYLEYLAPNLEHLIFTQHKGIMFSNVSSCATLYKYFGF